MGEVAETMTKKKKKKGRPSLLDLQKRSLKQQQHQHHHQHHHHHQQQQQQQQQEQQKRPQIPNFKNPNSLNLTPTPSRRSARRNPSRYGLSPASGWVDDDEDERKEKKHKLLLGLNSHNHQHLSLSSGPNSLSYGSDPNGDEGGEIPDESLKRRKINAVRHGSGEMGEKVSKATDTPDASPVESGPTTPLPDKKLLMFILDRLQKKDSYGVFSEPVDPEELPDYHEIIAHPMDFGTVRKKLDGGDYANLEQFEKDVFLICSNAMQYNSPDTIYFRQARSMQELARKDFENLRQDSDDSEPQPKVVRRGRPPGRSMKKLIDAPSLDRIASEFSSDATLATGGDTGSLSNAYNLRRGSNSYKLRPADTVVRAAHAPHNGETFSSWTSEWENEFPASVVRAVMKYGMKHFQVDENKRDTYNQASVSAHEFPVMITTEGEIKQLIPVGLSSEYGYARSLARFAADLGPVVWKIASKKIEGVLPPGLKFGPGWVGENKAVEQQQQLTPPEKQKYSNSSDNSSRVLSPTISASNSVIGNRYSLQAGEDRDAMRRLDSGSEFGSLSTTKPASSFQSQPKPAIHHDRNGFSGSFGLNSSSQMGMVRHATPPVKSVSNNIMMPSQTLGIVSSGNPASSALPGNSFDSSEANLAGNSSRPCMGNPSALGSGSWPQTSSNEGLVGESSMPELAYHKQDFHPFPPDLNVRFLSPGSPSSSVQIGSPQQPDLALQL